MVKDYVYVASNGVKYPCRIIRVYGTFADVQLESRKDDSFFIKVPIGHQRHSHKKTAYITLRG